MAEEMKRMQEKAREGFRQATGAAGETAQRTAGVIDDSFRAFTDSSTAMFEGLQEISREWLNMASGLMAANLDATTRLMRCRNMEEFFAAQREITSSVSQKFSEDSRRMAELTTKVFRRASERVEDQPRRAA